MTADITLQVQSLKQKLINISLQLMYEWDIHPVVREMFVDNFPHHSLLHVQHVRSEVKDDVEHAGLRGQCSAALLWQWIHHYLIVKVVWPQSS